MQQSQMIKNIHIQFTQFAHLITSFMFAYIKCRFICLTVHDVLVVHVFVHTRRSLVFALVTGYLEHGRLNSWMSCCLKKIAINVFHQAFQSTVLPKILFSCLIFYCFFELHFINFSKSRFLLTL